MGETWRGRVGIMGKHHGDRSDPRNLHQAGGLSHLALPAAYVPLGTEHALYNAYLLARTSLGTKVVVQAAGEALRTLDPELTIEKAGTLKAKVGQMDAKTRFEAILMSLFAVVALVLAEIGLYGVLAQIVGRRAREIGDAHGAGRETGSGAPDGQRGGGDTDGTGAALGLAGALAGGRIIRGLLFEVSRPTPRRWPPRLRSCCSSPRSRRGSPPAGRRGLVRRRLRSE